MTCLKESKLKNDLSSRTRCSGTNKRRNNIDMPSLGRKVHRGTSISEKRI